MLDALELGRCKFCVRFIVHLSLVDYLLIGPPQQIYLFGRACTFPIEGVLGTALTCGKHFLRNAGTLTEGLRGIQKLVGWGPIRRRQPFHALSLLFSHHLVFSDSAGARPVVEQNCVDSV